MIRGIKFVGIPVRDQDAALRFYTEKLGCKVVTDQPFTDKQRWIELLIPGAESGLALFTPDGHEKRIGDFQSISFWCEDVFATAKVLKSKGVQFAVEPRRKRGELQPSSRTRMTTNSCFRADSGLRSVRTCGAAG